VQPQLFGYCGLIGIWEEVLSGKKSKDEGKIQESGSEIKIQVQVQMSDALTLALDTCT
jgi:hypothetical protein